MFYCYFILILFFRYNSGGKCFSEIQTKHLTVTIDAFTLPNSLWAGKKVIPPRKEFFWLCFIIYSMYLFVFYTKKKKCIFCLSLTCANIDIIMSLFLNFLMKMFTTTAVLPNSNVFILFSLLDNSESSTKKKKKKRVSTKHSMYSKYKLLYKNFLCLFLLGTFCKFFTKSWNSSVYYLNFKEFSWLCFNWCCVLALPDVY